MKSVILLKKKKYKKKENTRTTLNCKATSSKNTMPCNDYQRRRRKKTIKVRGEKLKKVQTLKYPQKV